MSPVASPVRRVGSIDGIAAPRSMARPVARPSFNRPVVDGVQRAAAPSLNTPPPTIESPALPQQPALATSAPLVNDVQPALAGPTPTAPTEPQLISFAPPQVPAPTTAREAVAVPKKRRLASLLVTSKTAGRKLLQRRILVPGAAIVAVALIGWGVYAGLMYLRAQASPDTIYKDALTNALMTKQVQVSQQDPDGTITTQLDLSSLKAPRLTANATTMISGTSFSFKTYGTPNNTYVAYANLPSNLPAATAAAVNNRWVHLRTDGLLPAGISATLVNTADPHYQAFGPLLFANLGPKASQTTAQFLVDHKVYGYKLVDVHKVALGDKKVLLFSGSFDADYAQIANQSLATNAGFSVTDVQRVVDALSAFKGGTSALYVDPGTRLPLRLVLTTTNGQATTYDYSKFNDLSLPEQPSSHLDWPQFATTQLQLEAQASNTQTTTQRDTVRRNDLQTLQAALTQYYAKNGFYPSLANLNSQSWLATNLPSFDPDMMRDPQASSLTLLASAPVNAPAAKGAAKSPVPATPIYGYIYQATTTTGNSCANEATTSADQHCSLYSLTAILSNGQPYTVKNPQ